MLLLVPYRQNNDICAKWNKEIAILLVSPLHHCMSPQSKEITATGFHVYCSMLTFPNSESLSLQLTSVLPVTCYVAVLWPELWLQCQLIDCFQGCSGGNNQTQSQRCFLCHDIDNSIITRAVTGMGFN